MVETLVINQYDRAEFQKHEKQHGKSYERKDTKH